MDADPIGATLDGAYQLTRVIGRGGMGGVFEAIHLGNQQRYAVKLIAGELADDATYLERFRREALAATQLGHPNIVRTFEYHPDSGHGPYMVMELLEGRSLRDVLKTEGRLAPKRAIGIILELLSALQAAHDIGIVHRDLKPDNVFLIQSERGETVKLLDFGIAKRMNEDMHARLTRTGVLVGTPRYAAPEQLMSSRNVDARTDVYGAGMLLYCMLTGRPPFMSGGARLLVEIEDKEPTDPCVIVPSLSVDLIGVLRRATHKQPDSRFVSARLFADELSSFFASASERVEGEVHTTLVDPSSAPRRPVETKVFSSRPPRPAADTRAMPARAGGASTQASSPPAFGMSSSPVPETPASVRPVNPGNQRVSMPSPITLPDPMPPRVSPVPASAVPSSAVPSSAVPSSAVPSSAVPSSAAPRAVPKTVAMVAPQTAVMPAQMGAMRSGAGASGDAIGYAGSNEAWKPQPPLPPAPPLEPPKRRGGAIAMAVIAVIIAGLLAGGGVVLGMQIADERDAETDPTPTAVAMPAVCQRWEDLACGACAHLDRCDTVESEARGGDVELCTRELEALEDACHPAGDPSESGVVPPTPIGDRTCDDYARVACRCGSHEELRENCAQARLLVVGQAPSASLSATCRANYERLPEACRQ